MSRCSILIAKKGCDSLRHLHHRVDFDMHCLDIDVFAVCGNNHLEAKIWRHSDSPKSGLFSRPSEKDGFGQPPYWVLVLGHPILFLHRRRLVRWHSVLIPLAGTQQKSLGVVIAYGGTHSLLSPRCDRHLQYTSRRPSRLLLVSSLLACRGGHFF